MLYDQGSGLCYDLRINENLNLYLFASSFLKVNFTLVIGMILVNHVLIILAMIGDIQ